uniref:Flavin-containing monooxygenase n=1 Tax=Plectus sambesii TaxID=2011161 RepID=A0A914UQJ5_9BILA
MNLINLAFRTNTPLVVMAYPEYPIVQAADAPSFVRRHHVLAYLQSYAQEFDLTGLVQFGQTVKSIKPESKFDEDTRWFLSKQDRDTGAISTEIFDVVILATGNYSTPYLPSIDLHQFQGAVIHSRDYRRPCDYSEQTVVVLGAGPSALDISVDVASRAKQVYLLSGDHDVTESKIRFPSNVAIVPARISQGLGHAIVATNGAIIEHIDTILLCTGYRYSLPFLCESIISTNGGMRLTPLYKEVVSIRYPQSLFVMGLQRESPMAHHASVQARFILAHLEKRTPRLTTEEMLADEAKEVERRKALGAPIGDHTKFGFKYNNGRTLFRDYVEDLQATAKLGTVVPDVILDLFEDTVRKPVSELRRFRYRLSEDGKSFIKAYHCPFAS